GIKGQHSSEDSFDTTNSMVTLENETEVQAAHTYADTIYMKKGTSIELIIPNVDSDDAANASMNNYYRWFNYRNDKNFYVGNDIYGKDYTNYDLLTKGSSDYNGWTFGNGYVSGLLNTASTNTTGNGEANTLRKVTFYYPTDDEYIKYIKSRNLEDFDGQDNSFYAVACDLSNYTDFATTYTAGNSSDFSLTNDYCEPTLQERALFYIVGVDDTDVPEGLPEQFQHYWAMLNDGNYQGGTNTGEEKYLEEYEIAYPSQRISENPNDNEILTLSKEAQAYAIPGQSGSETLDVQFESDEDNDFTLTVSSTLSGTDRVIQFYNGTSGSQWSVDDGSKATILVTKKVGGTTYNIARYKLTFKKESIPLTEAQVAALDNSSSSYWWNDLGERALSYLENKCEFIASLDFDYENSGYGSSNLNSSTVYGSGKGEVFNYPFPLDWSSSGYAFYDGSFDVNPLNENTESTLDGYTYHTGSMLWNTYGIVNYYVGNLEDKNSITPWEPTCKSVKNHEGNWLYINPTDKPVKIAQLSFDKGDLILGSKLLVSAWIRNANAYHKDYDAAVLFTLIGVKADGTEEPLYRANSGQIETTNGSVALESEKGLDESVLGKGSGTNEWYQVFFSYKLKEEDIDQYDHFVIIVNNSCSQAQGGGFYFDELKVYKHNPTFEVGITPLETVRSGSDTPMRIDMDYQELMDCLGLDPYDYTSKSIDTGSLDFILINKDKYDENINGGATTTNALKSSIVDISYAKEESITTAST
ncbi:MAG: hypothetical protein LUC91_01720, partial [Prevotella sp.]|nr:hypothetical protein [Prevotella sp.]